MTIRLRLGGLLLFVCALALSCSAGSANKGKIGGHGGTGGSGGGSGGGAGAAGVIILSANCGDGHIDPNEACDDGNSVLGDGCSPSCQVEAGCACDDTKMHCTCGVCGDGKLGG